MTVVAFFEDLGVAISDVLLTVDVSGHGIDIPSIGSTNRMDPPLEKKTVTGLMRKFFRAGTPDERGTFLVCGTRNDFERVADWVECICNNSAVLSEYHSRRLNTSSLGSIVQTACEVAEKDGNGMFEILGVIGNDRFARHFNGGKLEQNLPYWGDVVAMGSGAPFLIDWLRKKGQYFLDMGLATDGLMARGSRALTYTRSLLLEEDSRSALTIRNGVGGYYESFVIAPGELIPLDNILTVFGELKAEGGEFAFELRRLMFHCYDGDTLIVGTRYGEHLSIAQNNPGYVALQDFETWAIPALGTQPTEKWSSHKLASKMAEAENFSLTMYFGENDGRTKRFYDGDEGRRLLDISISGDRIKLQLRIDDIAKYAERMSLPTAPAA